MVGFIANPTTSSRRPRASRRPNDDRNGIGLRAGRCPLITHHDWGILAVVERVVVLGRGGAGKSTAAAELGRITGLPVVELDAHFWDSKLVPLTKDDWVRRQQELAAAPVWIMDGDLGPYDAPATRLARADTVLILDFSLVRCAWRAARRSRERWDFWWWLLAWRYRSRPAVLQAVSAHAVGAAVHVVRSPRELRTLLLTATTGRFQTE